jgi:hypothetical protein
MLIEEIENTTAGSFDFNNIPSGFNRLIIAGQIRGDVSATGETVYIYMNSDTTASNYYQQRLIGDGASPKASEAANPTIGFSPAGSSPAGAYGNMLITIEDYAGANTKMATNIEAGPRASNDLRAGIYLVESALTAAITRIRIQTDNDPTDQFFGTLRLYGEL